MHVTHFDVTVSLLVGIITILAALIAVLRWIYRQGAAGERLILSVDANTSATAKLTDVYDRFAEKTGATLLDHEKRITRVEDRVIGRG